MDQFFRHRLFGQQQLHQLVAVHRQAFQHVMAGGFGVGLQLGRDLLVADIFAVVAVEIDGLHRDQVDHAFEVVFFADRPLHEERRRSRAFRGLARRRGSGSAPVRSILLMNANRGTW